MPEDPKEQETRVEIQKLPELPSAVIVTLGGYLEQKEARELADRVHLLLSQGTTKIVFDMSQVRYINSAAIAALANSAAALEGHGGKAVLLALSPTIQTVFETLGLLGIFETASTREEAVQALS